MTPFAAILQRAVEGTPNADSGDIYCPTLGQYYPDVQDCPNGWQRIIGAEASAAAGR